MSTIDSDKSIERVVLFLNPKAGSQSGRPLVAQLEALLLAAGIQVEAISELACYRERIKALRAAGNRFSVVAAGGDGTVGLVVNHTSPEIPIAILPLGTENLLAKQLRITADPGSVCQMICHGTETKVDAGEADGRVFLLMAGCGFDAEVVRRMDAQRTGHIHRLSYAKPILDSIRSYDYPELRVYCQPTPARKDVATNPFITARWVFVVNLPRYAGGLRIAPRAVGDDGLLDVCTFKDGSLVSGLRYLSGVVLGQHEGWDDFQTLRTDRLRIECDRPAPYQLDGDPGGTLPVNIRVLPARATMLVPSDPTDGFGSPNERQSSERDK